MRNKLIIIFSLFSFSLYSQIGGNIKLMKPAAGEGYTIYTDSTGRQAYILFSSLVDDSTGLDARVDSLSFDTTSRDLIMYFNDESIPTVTVNLPIVNGERDTTVSVANLQLFSTQPVIVEGDTMGLKVEMSHNGGEFWLMTESTGRIKIRKKGHFAYFDTVDEFNADSLNGQDSTYYLTRLDSVYFDTLTGAAKWFLTNGDSLIFNLDGRYLLQDDAKLAGIEAGAEVNVQSDWDATTGDALVLNKPTTITAGQANEITANTAKNTYPSADASKLAGIAAGAEVNVQSDWDATTGDAFILNKPSLFDGNYNSLSNLPSLFDGNYNSLSNLPSLFSGSYTDLINKPTINNLITTGLGLDLEAINTELYLNFAELPTDDTPISTSYFVYADATEEKKISLTEFNAVIAPTWANVSGKPTTITAGQASAITANTAKNTYPSADATKLAGIATGAEVNVNADWDATTGDALVLNKPSLFSGSYTDLTNKPTINNLASANQTQTGANGSTRIYSYYNKGLWFASSGTGSAFTVQAKDIGIAATAGGSILIDGEGGTVNIQPASGTNVGGFMKNITTFGRVEFEKILGTDVTVTDPTTAGNNDLNTALSNINSNVGATGPAGADGAQGIQGATGPAGADGITGVIFQETGNLNFTLINNAIIRFNSTDFNLDSSNPSLLTITTNKTNMLSTNLTGSANPSHTNTGTWSLQNNLSNGATSNLQFTNTQSNLIYGKSGILGSVTIEEDGAKLLHTANIANGFAELNVKQVNGKTNVIAELENYANEAAAIADTDLLQFSLYRIGTDVRIKL